MTDLAALPRSMRLALTLFLLSALLGFGLSLVLEFRRTGMSRSGLSSHLRGDGEFAPPMAVDTMLATTHPHATTVPVLLLAVGLPFLLGRRASEVEKVTLTAAAWAGFLLSVAAHYLVRFLGEGWYFAFAVGGTLLCAGFIWPPLRALQEMWGKRRGL